MSHSFTESTTEQAAIDWLKVLGYNYAFSPETAFDGWLEIWNKLCRRNNLHNKIKVIELNNEGLNQQNEDNPLF